MNVKKTLIAVTMGDAAGVGPELCLRLLNQPVLRNQALPVVIGDACVLERVAAKLRVPFKAPVARKLDAAPKVPTVVDLGALAGKRIEPGRHQAACGAAAARYIEEAVAGCLARTYAGMVTAPISKKALNLAGIKYPGHTEMLAALTRTHSYAMLFYSPQMCCAFVTCHQSLRSVPAALNIERIAEVGGLAWDFLRRLGQRSPVLALPGLNPHASEGGLFGDEEERVLIPARARLRRRGIRIEGPLPADTIFTPEARRRYSCYLSLYHDQGSIPFKMLAFDTGVNVTLGLPIIRTSPDHGTAFDIAWRGRSRSDSFLAAYKLAVQLAGRARIAKKGRP